jgi:hypothetical protein
MTLLQPGLSAAKPVTALAGCTVSPDIASLYPGYE